MKIIILFPGQGSQAPGMGKSWHDDFPLCREIFEQASDAIKLNLRQLCFSGPESELAKTENTQPCLLTACFAGFKILEKELGIAPAAAAGHSLGEYTALAAAGAIAFPDALKITRRRGEVMSRAASSDTGMMAVLGLSEQEVTKLCEDAKGNQMLVPSNFNAPGQGVISGQNAALERASEILKNMKKRGLRLKVSGAFHSPLMHGAAEEFAVFLAAVNFHPPRFPVVSNLEARPYDLRGPDALRSADTLVRTQLILQMTSPVRWQESIEYLATLTPDLFLEIGPGKVLSGLVAKILPQARIFSFSESAQLPQIASGLKSLGH